MLPSLWNVQRSDQKQKKTDILQGTLDLMVLKTLDALGPLHGYGIARRIEQISDSVLPTERGHGLHGLVAVRATGLDCVGVGIFGEQPAGAILFDFAKRPKAAGAGNPGMERMAGVIGRLLQVRR